MARVRRCSVCGSRRHNCRTCPELGSWRRDDLVTVAQVTLKTKKNLTAHLANVKKSEDSEKTVENP